MGLRRKGRELALQAIYVADITKLGIEKTIMSVVNKAGAEDAVAEFAKHLASSTVEHQTELDKFIQKYAKHWEMGRMAALDRNILRLGAYELLYETETPVSVIIDEAVEIAKTFSTEESGKFVNGILDQIKNERKNGEQAKS